MEYSHQYSNYIVLGDFNINQLKKPKVALFEIFLSNDHLYCTIKVSTEMILPYVELTNFVVAIHQTCNTNCKLCNGIVTVIACVHAIQIMKDLVFGADSVCNPRDMHQT